MQKKLLMLALAMTMSSMPVVANDGDWSMEALMDLRCILEGSVEEMQTMPALQRAYLDRLLTLVDMFHNGADVNTTLPNANNTTALHNACALGYYDVVEVLLQNGANPHARAANGATPRQCVSNDKGNRISKLLAQYEKKSVSASAPSAAVGSDGMALVNNLRATSYSGAVQKLYQRRLLSVLPQIINGASVDIIIPKANGTTALHNACGLGRLDIVTWLLENGANPNARTAKGATPLQCVGTANTKAIAKLLKQYGAK